MIKRFSFNFSLFLFLSDLALVVIALLLATELRQFVPLGREFDSPQLPLFVYVIALLIWAFIFILFEVYLPTRSLRLINELQVIARATIFAWLSFTGALYLTFRLASRLQVVYFGLLFAMLVTVHRIAVRLVFRITGGRSQDARKVLVIGTGKAARDVGQMIQQHAWAGLYLFGYVRSQPTGETELYGKPVFGPYMKTLDIISDQGISEVVIAVPSLEEQDTAELIYALHSQPVNLRIVPDYFDLVFLRANVENFGSLPLLTLKEPSLDPFQRLTKRVFDLIVTSVLMIPALPLMGLIAAAIKLDDPGPALFKQDRVGEGGKIFQMMKFRTMIIGAEKMQEAMAEINEDGILIHKRPDDPRITRIGHFLRRTSLDELPQFFNILKGDMSLVGPRPEMPWLVDKYDAWQRKRFEVPQGLTGWWQVNGRAERMMHLHTDEDLFYIRNYSLALDIQIILRTVLVVLTGRGAY